MIELISGLETTLSFQEGKINFQSFAGDLVKTCTRVAADDNAMCYIVMGRQFPKMSDMGLDNAAQPEMQYQIVSANPAAKMLIGEIGIFHAGSVHSGIAGRVLQAPYNTIVVNDATAETHHRLINPEVQSQLAVAITSKSLCFGAIIIESFQPDTMTDLVVRSIELLAKQMAMAIEQRPRRQRIAEKITAKLQWDQKYEQISRYFESLNSRTLASGEPTVLFWQVLHDETLLELGSLFDSREWMHLELMERSEEVASFKVLASNLKYAKNDTVPITLSGDTMSQVQDDSLETTITAVGGLESYIANAGVTSNSTVYLLPIQSFFDEALHILLYIQSYSGDERWRISDVKRLLNEIVMRVNGGYNIAQYKYAQLIYDQDRNIFIQDVMHQLNTAMGSILIDTENLIDKDIPPDEYDDAFERLYELANMARSYTDTVSIAVKSRTLFEMYTQEFTTHSSEDLEFILAKVANYFRGKCRAYHIDGPIIMSETFVDLPDVKLHRELFELAMVNFLDNAVKYSFRLDHIGAKGRSLPESVPLIVEAQLTEDGEFVDIGITNHGIPLSKADIDLIFNRLERSESARLHAPRGTGIGLYICNEIAKVHNGAIIVNESEPSEVVHLADKVTFTMRVPTAKM